MSSGRRTSNSRLLPRPKDDELFLECKAAYLTMYDDVADVISSKADLTLLLQQTGRNPSQKTISTYWRKSTENLSFDDFCDICKKELVTSEDQLLKSFRKMDTNGDGFLSLKELSKALTGKGEKMSTDEVRAIMDEVDENRDGKLDYKEFCNLVMSTTKELQTLSRRRMEKTEKLKKQNREPMSSRVVEGRDNKEPITKPRSARSASRGSISNDFPKPQPRSRSKSDDVAIPAVVSRRTCLNEPRNLKDWHHVALQGCFHIDEDFSIISHEYTMKLSQDASVWVTIQPKSSRLDEPTQTIVDTGLFILRHSSSGSIEERLLTLTEERDGKGKYGVRCDIQKGNYIFMPFTTGCKLRRRRHEPKVEAKLIKRDKDGKYTLTKQFREALSEIFDLCDITGSGTMSRTEFNLYNIRTSGEEVADAEWDVVEESVELKNGEITWKGFLQLNQMEADDNEGDTDDLWVTLRSMGYNKNLVLDEACPFLLDVYIEEGGRNSNVDVQGFTDGKDVQRVMCQSVINKGDSTKIVRDVNLYSYLNDGRKTFILENKSRAKVSVRLDCSKSQNVASNQGELDVKLDVPGRNTVVGLHLVPVIEKLEWVVKCTETLEV